MDRARARGRHFFITVVIALRRRTALYFFPIVLLGCGGARPLTRGAPEAPTLLAVPFFPDDTQQCGPATLASVLQFWGHRDGPETLREEIYNDRLRGTLSLDMLLAVQRRGLEGEIVTGTLEQVRGELRGGRPVIAFLNLGYRFFPQGHYVVLTGFDAERLRAHSATRKDHWISNERFLRSWEKMDHWALLVRPSGAS